MLSKLGRGDFSQLGHIVNNARAAAAPPPSSAWLWAAGASDWILWAAGGTDVILLESDAGGGASGTPIGLLLALTQAA